VPYGSGYYTADIAVETAAATSRSGGSLQNGVVPAALGGRMDTDSAKNLDGENQKPCHIDDSHTTKPLEIAQTERSLDLAEQSGLPVEALHRAALA
jgi:hypothetical protein